jgi:hypothetical protein
MKKLILTLVFVFFAASVSAQTLQDFESSFDENFQKGLAGGEDFNGTINFSSGVDRPAPLVVEVTVESESTEFETGDLEGEEFDVAAGFAAEGFDWKPAVWDLVQRGQGEILVAEESVRENDSIPEAVYVPRPLEVEEDELPEGYGIVETAEELDDVDFTYDPETTPGDTMDLGDYSGDAGYAPVAAPVNDGVSLIGSFEAPEELNASYYSLAAPVLSSPLPEEETGLWFSREVERLDDNTLRYSFALDRVSVYPESRNSILVQVGADPRIKSDSFDFSFEVKSQVGVMGENETEEVEASEPVEVEAGDAEVAVNASGDANVTVWDLEQVSVPEPSESEFVGGVSVDVSNSSGEVEASGTVTVTYDDDDFDDEEVDVYYYDDSGEENEWENIGGTHYLDNNSVVAEVDHFSTYAAFSQDQDSDSGDEDDGGVSLGDLGLGEEEEEDENQTDTQEEEGDEDRSQDESGEEDDTRQEENVTDDQAEDQQSEDQEEPGQGDDQQVAGPTGMFASEPGTLYGGVLVLLLAFAAALQYTGRVDFTEVPDQAREKLSRD